jgi:hypothetical protein
MAKPTTPVTVGFGAPDSYGAHLFKVVIPAERTGSVKIIEHFGYEAHGNVVEELRVEVPRIVWSAIADVARREFNVRLRKLKMPAARWRVGDNSVDRVLGRELCVLAWAAELAGRDVASVAATKWSALQPEERWWLYAMTNAEAGLAADSNRGWRVALRSALTDGTPPRPRIKRVSEDATPSLLNSPTLFEDAS